MKQGPHPAHRGQGIYHDLMKQGPHPAHRGQGIYHDLMKQGPHPAHRGQGWWMLVPDHNNMIQSYLKKQPVLHTHGWVTPTTAVHTAHLWVGHPNHYCTYCTPMGGSPQPPLYILHTDGWVTPATPVHTAHPWVGHPNHPCTYCTLMGGSPQPPLYILHTHGWVTPATAVHTNLMTFGQLDQDISHVEWLVQEYVALCHTDVVWTFSTSVQLYQESQDLERGRYSL